MPSDFEQVIEIYDQLQNNADRTKPLWDSISKYTGIRTQPDYRWNKNNTQPQEQLDDWVDDPTAAISVNQAGDYLVGIMWGTGERVFDLEPSPYVLEKVSKEAVEEYYKFATNQTLYHMNHPDAGYAAALRPYAYDQVAFGTSGVGTFPNQAFVERKEHNALIYQNYGVDNVVIDVGRSGLVDWVFATYHWRVSRIVGEFAMVDGVLDKAEFEKLPKSIRDAYNKQDMNQEFDIVFGVMPREDFNASLKGKKGARWRGVWFMRAQRGNTKTGDGGFFKEESFKEKPISIARMIVVRGEVYGRSSGTMLLSSIRSVNYMIGTAIEVIEKMADPALGVYGNAVFGDSVLDTSPTGLTVFNSTFTGKGNPVFPLYDVGDPSALVQFLIPYLNEKITTAFKVDALLDFSSDKEMTATESLQRFTIRGQSLSGILSQQKTERLIPDIKRAVSILDTVGELGIDSKLQPDVATELRSKGKANRVIPQAVQEVKASGRPWFDIRFNNDLEKLMRTEKVQNLLQIVQSITLIFPLYPDIVEAVDWYKLLKDINDNLDANNQIMLNATQFKKRIAAIAEQRAAAAALKAGQAGAAIEKDAASANRANQEAATFGRE